MTSTITLSLFLVTTWISALAQVNGQVVRMSAIKDFPTLIREGNASNRKPYGPYHIEEDLHALAGDDLNYTFHIAAAEGIFPGKTGRYMVNLNTLTERDGECVYNVYVNDVRVGLFQQNPPTNEFTAPATLQWTGVDIPENALIRVESNNWSNLKRHEENFFEYARGRWTSIDFIPEKENNQQFRDNANYGIFEIFETIGPSVQDAQLSYNSTEQAYYLAYSDKVEAHGKESCVFLYRTVNGDFALEVLATHIMMDGNGDRQAGLLMRQAIGSRTEYVAGILEENGNVILEYGDKFGSPLEKISFTVRDAEMIQLEKKGNTYTVSAAKFGEEYERHTIELAGTSTPQQIGLFLSSTNTGKQAVERFSHVRFFEDMGL